MRCVALRQKGERCSRSLRSRQLPCARLRPVEKAAKCNHQASGTQFTMHKSCHGAGASQHQQRTHEKMRAVFDAFAGAPTGGAGSSPFASISA